MFHVSCLCGYPSGVGYKLRAGPSGVGSLRAGTLETRSLGGSGPSGVGRMRAGTLEARSLGGSPTAISPVAVPCFNSCSVPKCNNDLIICLFFISMFLMLICCYDIIFVSSMFHLSLKHISFSLFLWLPECTASSFLKKPILCPS